MPSHIGIVGLACLLFAVNCINAVPFYDDFMHRLMHPSPLHHTLFAPFPLAQLTPIESLQSQASQRQNVWTQQQQHQQQQQPYDQYANAPLLPHLSSFSTEPDAEFVPLEQQSRNERPKKEEKPFNIDVITSEVNGHNPGLFFQQTFPIFGSDFFNTFGGFGFGHVAHEPWWKGPNICTEKQEDETTAEAGDETVTDSPVAAATETDERDVVPSRLFGQFHFSVNSCNEKPNKHVCKKIVNQNGVQKTLTIIRQCCYGYGRARNADYTTPCEKIDIKDLEAAAGEMGAQQFIVNAKNSGELNSVFSAAGNKKLTFFLPSDTAYTDYRAQHSLENNVVGSKPNQHEKELYQLHTIGEEVYLDDAIYDKLIPTTFEGQSIRINSYQLPVALGLEPYRYAANCIPIEKYDKLTQQGVVHILNGVLKPVRKTIMDLIRERADMSIMRTVLEKTNLSEQLEGTKPMTIFVPTDDAFDKLEPHLRRTLKEGKGCASNILKNHMLDLTFCSIASVPGAKTTAYNLLGEPLLFNRTTIVEKDHAQSRKIESAASAKTSIVINGAAKVLEADIVATNGVLHVLDAILPTQTALPITLLMQEKNLTLFKQLLEISGYDNEFDDLNNITVFAPTDKALQNTEWAKLLEENPASLKNNNELLLFLNYHVAQPMIKTCDLTERKLTTMSGASVRVNLYSTHALFSDIMNRATVNCARLIHFDDESCGSVLHQVDRPLIQPKQSLLAALEANPNYNKFLELVRNANLTHILANESDSYTLLVPKNDVFDEFQVFDSKVGQSKEELKTLVKTHIVNDVVCCAGIIPTNWPFVRSIESLNAQHLRITRDRRPKIENAGVTKCDIIATNGIIHEINDVIVPTRRVTQRQSDVPLYPQQNGDFDVFF